MTEPKGIFTPTRRGFLTTSAAGTAAFLAAAPLVHARGNETIKVGLIGCGGRGRGAAENIAQAAGTSYNIKLHAFADVFPDRLNDCVEFLKGNDLTKERLDAPKERQFVGFDAYQKVIDCCDLVMLATPPGFRPQHIEAVVKAGKNLFTEKPVAVDGTGIRKVLAAAEMASSKKLAIVAGTQRRHSANYVESMKRIKDGEIGEVRAAKVAWNQGNIWANGRKDGWGEVEYQLRNWYHFTWLCGGCIVEQHVHNLDVALWAIGTHPTSCVGMGGREVNTGPEFGESWDHFAVNYDFPNGVVVTSQARQIAGCDSDVSEFVIGSKGTFSNNDYRFNVGGKSSRVRIKEVNPYVQEHIDLLESITSGKPVNELKQVAESTLTAIMGRMSAYTGKAVTWEQALNSKLNTFPDQLAWDAKLPGPTLPRPGSTPLV
jgi:myo-inositol 2-dehydrogenase/D-chiro-inositol 1-dehydrogenase